MIEELIREARDYALALHSSVHVRHTGAELIDKLCDALEAATVEPEWEYQWGDPAGICNDTFNGYDHYETFDAAKADMDQDNDYPYSRVVRRRKAGPWLPVGGESE